MDSTRSREVALSALATCLVFLGGAPASADTEPCLVDPPGEPATPLEAREGREDGAAIVFRAQADARTGRLDVEHLLAPARLETLTVSAEGGSLPQRVDLVTDGGTQLSVAMPKGATEAHVSLGGLSIRCLVLAWRAGAGTLSFTFHTDATPENLVRGLAEGGEPRLRAVALLPRLGAHAVEALEAAFDSMTARERRDALRVYAALASHPSAERRLIEAATADDPAQRRLAAAALEGSTLLEAARHGSREAAAKAARTEPAAMIELALDRLSEAPPPEDARRFLLEAARTLDAEGRLALARSLSAAPVVVRARALEPLVAVPALRPALLPSLVALLHAVDASGEPLSDEAFELAFRAARAARAYGGGARDELAAPLERLRGAHEWMLRAAALRALGAIGAEPSALSPGLVDPYPRVRIAALEAAVAASHVEVRDDALRRAAEDEWPSVRARAVRLAARDDLLLGSHEDRSPRVRIAVLSSWLGRGDQADSLRRALRREPSLVVKGAVLEAATTRCVPGLHSAARDVLEQAGTADDDAAHAGEALRYLLAFEGEARDALLDALAARGVPRSKLPEAPRCERKNAL